MASHTSEVRTWLGHRIPHDFLGAAVQNSRKINEPGPRADAGGGTSRLRGNVPAPLTPGLVGGEVPPHQVGVPIEVVGRHGSTDFCPWLRGLQAQLMHDGTDRGAACPHAVLLQVGLDPSIPVNAIGVLKSILDHDTELFPPHPGDGLRSVPPGVVARP